MQQNVLVISNLASATNIGLGRATRIITEMGHLPHLVITGIDVSKSKTPEQGAQTLLPADLVLAQLQRSLEARVINAVVVGSPGLSDGQKRIAEYLLNHKKKRLIPVIVNPCLPIDENDPAQLTDSVQDFIKDLCPIADVVTPSVREAEALTGRSINNLDDMVKAAEQLLALGCKTVFLHGGVFQDNHTTYIFVTESSHLTFSTPRMLRKIPDRRHGFGSALASAIAVSLAKGQNYEACVERALVQMKRLALSEL